MPVMFYDGLDTWTGRRQILKIHIMEKWPWPLPGQSLCHGLSQGHGHDLGHGNGAIAMAMRPWPLP